MLRAMRRRLWLRIKRRWLLRMPVQPEQSRKAMAPVSAPDIRS